VWRDGACERTIEADQPIWNLAMLDDRRFIRTTSFTAELWTLDQPIWNRVFEVHGGVTCVAVMPDGVHFVVGLDYEEDGDVRMYHVDGTLVHTFTDDGSEPELQVVALAVTPDGQHIISGSWDWLVKVWSVASKSLVSTCEGHLEIPYAVEAMPDGQHILSGGADKTVRMWLLNGTLENTFFELHTGTVNALVALPDNQHALSGAADKTVKLFNVNNGAVLRTFKNHAEGAVEAEGAVLSLALLPDGLRFVSGSWDMKARIFYHGLAP
jgi:WD40 repeat protein